MGLEIPFLPEGISVLSSLLATLPLAGEGQQHLRDVVSAAWHPTASPGFQDHLGTL